MILSLLFLIFQAQALPTDVCERGLAPKISSKLLFKVFKNLVSQRREIPESSQVVLTTFALEFGMSVEDVEKNIIESFGDFNLFIELAKSANANFPGAIDRRIFTEDRREKLLRAVRNSSDLILFKLAENQDVTNWEEIFNLSDTLKAPIIVAPAFSEIGLIPQRLQAILNNPRVHLLVDPTLQISKDFYVVNNGSPDKVQTPLTGLDEVFEPTDRVLLFHPRIDTQTRASLYYDSRRGYLETTGSMSSPAYHSMFNVGMTTDYRAQRTAEQNRSLTILSRRYQNKKLSEISGSAHGMMARRVHVVKSHWGNPAGLFDLNKIYFDQGAVEIKYLPGIVLGDLHWGVTDPAKLTAFFKLLIELKVLAKNLKHGQPGQLEYIAGPIVLGRLVLHDLVDGIPFNHHLKDKLISRSLLDQKGYLDIENHFISAAAFVTQLSRLLPKTQIVVPVDNHGYDWIQSTLQSGILDCQPRDLPIVLKLMLDASKGTNPYEQLLRYYGIESNPKRFLFFNNDDQNRIAIDGTENDSTLNGVEISKHGNQGINGAKSISIKSMLAAYGASVSGHVHTTSERGRSRQVGSLTPNRQDYHRGPSKNDTSLALIYSKEAVQTLRLERNSFLPNAKVQDPDDFFDEGFPKLTKWPEGKTTDQFRTHPPIQRFPR